MRNQESSEEENTTDWVSVTPLHTIGNCVWKILVIVYGRNISNKLFFYRNNLTEMASIFINKIRETETKHKALILIIKVLTHHPTPFETNGRRKKSFNESFFFLNGRPFTLRPLKNNFFSHFPNLT